MFSFNISSLRVYFVKVQGNCVKFQTSLLVQLAVESFDTDDRLPAAEIGTETFLKS
jgi:hypothetical protein